MPEAAVYVGRPTFWGNPWKIDQHFRLLVPTLSFEIIQPDRGLDHAAAAARYRAWLESGSIGIDVRGVGKTAHGGRKVAAAMHERRIKILSRLHELCTNDLVCWCPLNRSCHADVLLELANR